MRLTFMTFPPNKWLSHIFDHWAFVFPYRIIKTRSKELVMSFCALYTHTHTFHFLVEFLIKAKRLKREVQECDDRIFLTLIQTQIHSQYSRAGYKTNENRCHKWDSLHFNGDNRLHNEVWTRHDRHPAYNKSACMNLISADSINGVWF